MDTLPRSLQYGEEFAVATRSTIFAAGATPEDKPVYYLVAGLVKTEYRLREGRFALWIPPDTVFGLVEPLSECARLCSATAMERTILYRWDMEGFFTAAGVSWELALTATTGLTRELRILNAEFGERIRAAEGSPR
jgi:CRP-like cAMP-binding protein